MRVHLTLAALAGTLVLAGGSAQAQDSIPVTIYSPSPLIEPADPRVTATVPYTARVYGYTRYYGYRDERPRYRLRCSEWDLFWFHGRCRPAR